MIKRTNISGMSLAEVAIAMLIIAAAFGSVVSILPTTKLRDDISETQRKLDKIESAIYSFYNKNGYLPCPASRTELKNSANFGVSTDCAGSASGVVDVVGASKNIRIGSVPVRTLNLPDDFMFDAWDMRFTYHAIKENSINKQLFDSNTNFLDNDFVIIDNNPAQYSINTGTDIGEAYALISHGKNRKGAYNDLGVVPVSCNLSHIGLVSSEDENCDDDNMLFDAPHSINISTYNDDILRWRTIKNVITLSGGAPANCDQASSTFLPTDIYGLVLWLDANDISKITKDGSNNVSQWTDKSPYIFVFTPAGSNHPVYSATGFNGKPAMTFNNKNGFILSSSSYQYALPATNITIFFAGQQNSITNANYLLDRDTATNRFAINLNMNGNNFWYMQSTNLYSGTTYNGNVYATWMFSDGASPEASLYVNGNLITSNNSFVNLSSAPACFKIGESCTTGGPTDFYGSISEIIAFNRVLNDNERKLVESYLKSKWGL